MNGCFSGILRYFLRGSGVLSVAESARDGVGTGDWESSWLVCDNEDLVSCAERVIWRAGCCVARYDGDLNVLGI